MIIALLLSSLWYVHLTHVHMEQLLPMFTDTWSDNSSNIFTPSGFCRKSKVDWGFSGNHIYVGHHLIPLLATSDNQYPVGQQDSKKYLLPFIIIFLVPRDFFQYQWYLGNQRYENLILMFIFSGADTTSARTPTCKKRFKIVTSMGNSESGRPGSATVRS